jgi:hypothetical protein
VVLFGYETFSLILWYDHRLTILENRVLRTIFGLMIDDVTGDWRKLHNEVLHIVYSLPSVIRVIKSRLTETEYVA